MEKNKGNFSMDEIKKIAQSETGRQLMALLQGSSAADQVRSGAQSGNMEQAKDALADFLSDPKAQKLLKQLEEQCNG